MIQKKELLFGVNKKSLMQIAYGAVGAAALVFGALYAFRTYKVHQGRKAQFILSESLHEFATNMVHVNPQWGEVQLMNEVGAQQASGTPLQPFFVVMQAQAMAQQHKYEEAVATMQQALEMLPSDSPYKSYFTLTKHLMQLDAPAEKEAGFAGLQALAQDAAYPYRDAALYHVAEYYSSMQDAAHAKQTWQELVSLAPSFAGSPWVALAQQKLTTV